MLGIGLGLDHAAARPRAGGAMLVPFAAVAGTSVEAGGTRIVRGGSAAGYGAIARSTGAVPGGGDLLLMLRSGTDDAQFAVGFGGPEAASLDALEWYVECDSSQVYARSYLKGSRVAAHGAADMRDLRLFLRRTAGVWSVATGTSDDPAAAAPFFTYDPSGIDGNGFYATALLHTPGMALDAALTARTVPAG